MEEKLNERKQVVDVLVKSAIVSRQEDGYYRVLVPGAIREENIVSAENEAEAVEKVRSVLYVKEQSKLEGLEKVEAKRAAGEQTEDGDVEVSPENMKIKMKATVRTEETK
jgi:MOSC domain-containing protein YiiM